jgi:hypothetical protein
MKALYPYKTLFGDVVVRIDRVTVDGEPLPASRIDSSRREIDLAELERAGWRTAAISVEVGAPPTEVAEIAAQGGDPAAILVAHCGPTNARQTVRLTAESDDPSRWSGRLDLERLDWFGRISMRPVVTASVDSITGRIIGEGEIWTVALDDMPRPNVTGAITITWEDFSSPSNESLSFLRSRNQDPFFLHLAGEAPVLYLNRAFEGLFALLEDRRRRPPGEQSLHDETRGAIAAETWLALFNASLQAIERYDEQESNALYDWPESEWQRAVLQLVLDRMYPEKTPEDALREVGSVLDEPEGGTTIQQLALPAIVTHAGATRLLRQAIARIGTDPQEVHS